MPAAKICGLSTEQTLDAAIGGGASHVGFVAFPPSPRDVAPDRLVALATRVPAHATSVGVFVDPDDALLAKTAPALPVLQLHHVTPQRAAAIRERFGKEVWVALPVRTRADLTSAREWRGAADRIVYDAKTPDDAALPGGMGLRFDWALLDGFEHPLPWVLSGGLDAANVGEAIGRTEASLVDVSSGVERAPGIKDAARIAAFLAAVARA